MGCTVCKQAFVQVATLLRDLKRETGLSPEVQARMQTVATMVTVAGHHIVEVEIERDKEAGHDPFFD